MESHDRKAQNPATHARTHPSIHSFNKRIRMHRLPLRIQRHSKTIKIMKRSHALLFIPRSPPPDFSRSRISYTIPLDSHQHVSKKTSKSWAMSGRVVLGKKALITLTAPSGDGPQRHL